eukprot:PITA_10744
MAALSLAEKGLIGQFTGLWPSPKTVQRWVERNWSDKTQGKISIRFCGKGYYTFHFETKEDKDLIFRNRPYFMDSRGLYLNKWTPDFDPELDIPNAVPVWVRLPHLPLHCWGDESVKAIGNAVGKYIDRSEPKDNMQACARICVEVDLGKGLPEAIKLKVDEWSSNLTTSKSPLNARRPWGSMGNRKKKKAPPSSKSAPSSDIPGSSSLPPNPPSSSLPSNPSPDPPSPSTSNPFLILSSEETLPENPPLELSDLSKIPLSLSQPASDPRPPRTTRSSSKDIGASSDLRKKLGPGRKTAKQHREENTQKDIALGLQTPMDSFITGSKETESSGKDHERRAPLRTNVP